MQYTKIRRKITDETRLYGCLEPLGHVKEDKVSNARFRREIAGPLRLRASQDKPLVLCRLAGKPGTI